jgi:hypothetical protein
MRRNGIPSCTEPSKVSDLISERLGIPSTKYGPSICCGVPSTSINDDLSVQVRFVEALFFGLQTVLGEEGRGIVVLKIAEEIPFPGC